MTSRSGEKVQQGAHTRWRLTGFIPYFDRRFREEPFFGSFAFFRPSLVLVDLDVIKTVLATDFTSFQKNDFEFDEELEVLLNTNPFALSGAKWKRARNQVIPAFTSGRMKVMYPLMTEVAQKLTKYISEQNDATTSTGLDAKDLSEKFAMDNVATCAFGIDAESFTNPKSDFIRLGRKLFETTALNIIKFIIIFMAPWLTKLLRIRFVPKETSDWMVAVINQNVEYREKNNVSRDDFLQGMMNLRNKTHIDYQQMTGHSLSFLTDGYETSSGVLAFALYAVAHNKDVQEYLRREIEEVSEKYDGCLNYEAIMEMHYLERIIYGKCTQQCTLQGKGNETLTMEPDDSIMIPVMSIHNDPEYYPDPERFDPDRFTDDEKSARHPFAFLGFGGGPRMCLGMRFALLQIKVALLHTVMNYELTVAPKTQNPIKLDKKAFLYKAEGGLWINFKKLKNN
ncbi:probable cytochrome P450 6a13 [Ctenocephalides felis]|uniref:probable cytochrome P450 6a13 n=1 Tax=Ctenocephalides felis TaxID=7515 RepID=UPI000E6E1EE5|nr:probable cytochrome P450 6a13 [Ctenocephalides felis]